MYKSIKDRLEKYSVQIPFSGCFIWTGYVNKFGYGKITVQGKSKYAHRISYTEFVGEIPNNFCIDHLCKNTSCINPNHLEVVTQKENVNRGNCSKTLKKLFANMTHCKHGHEFTEKNTYLHPTNNRRSCKTCRTAAAKKSKELKNGK